MKSLAGVFVFTLSLLRRFDANEGECFVGKIIATEDDVAGTCTKTCPDASGNTGRAGCDLLSNCRQHMQDWSSRSERCDICECDCYKNCKTGEKCESASGNTVTYVSCDSKCSDTCSIYHEQFNTFGCKEMKNCRSRQQVPLSDLFQCDVCQCDCDLPSIETLDFEHGRNPSQCYGDSNATTPSGGPNTPLLPEQPTRRPCGGVEGSDCSIFGLQDDDGTGFCDTGYKHKCVAIPSSSTFTPDGVNTLNVMTYNINERDFAKVEDHSRVSHRWPL